MLRDITRDYKEGFCPFLKGFYCIAEVWAGEDQHQTDRAQHKNTFPSEQSENWKVQSRVFTLEQNAT